ncbi:MAG: hypothetical protein MJ099_05230 [Clostridia bacterium]|nr:hypothetical protein [Clostridia bacterium]
MKSITRAILPDYEIDVRTETPVSVLQLGASPILLGLADRLLDSETDRSVCVIRTSNDKVFDTLKEQEGLLTLLVRGEEKDTTVKREQVLQCIRRVLDPAVEANDFDRMAADETIDTVLFAADEDAGTENLYVRDIELMTRIILRRKAANAAMPAIVCINIPAAKVKAAVAEYLDAMGLKPECMDGCRFVSAVAEGFVTLADPAEAIRQCEKMNYKDALIHIAEPYARISVETGCDLFTAVDDIETVRIAKDRIFDAGLFLIAALGFLHGNATLGDCMRDTPLRENVGRAFMDELLPHLPIKKEDADKAVITAFGRYENALNDNHIFECARGLLSRFPRTVLPTLEAYIDEHFALPPKLVMAISATLWLYADVRKVDNVYLLPAAEDSVVVHDDPYILDQCLTLASDMPSETLAYAMLADRSLWDGRDLREIEGLEEAVSDNMSMLRTTDYEKKQ